MIWRRLVREKLAKINLPFFCVRVWEWNKVRTPTFRWQIFMNYTSILVFPLSHVCSIAPLRFHVKKRFKRALKTQTRHIQSVLTNMTTHSRMQYNGPRRCKQLTGFDFIFFVRVTLKMKCFDPLGNTGMFSIKQMYRRQWILLFEVRVNTSLESIYQLIAHPWAREGFPYRILTLCHLKYEDFTNIVFDVVCLSFPDVP